jgi:hypothetical protein
VRTIRQLLFGAVLVLTVCAGLVTVSSPAGADTRYEGTVQMTRTDVSVCGPSGPNISVGGSCTQDSITYTYAGTTVGPGFTGVMRVSLEGIDCFQEEGWYWCDTLAGTWSVAGSDSSVLSGTLSTGSPVSWNSLAPAVSVYFYVDVTKATGSYAGQSGHGSLYGNFYVDDTLPAFNGTLRVNLA